MTNGLWNRIFHFSHAAFAICSPFMCIRIVILQNTRTPNVSSLHDRETFVDDSLNRPISIKNRRKLIAYTSCCLSIFYSIKIGISFKCERGKVEKAKTSRLFTGAPYRGRDTQVTSFFSVSAWPRFRCNAEDAAKAPLSKATGSTLKRQQRKRWAG